MVRSDSGSAFHSCWAAYWNDLLPKVSSKMSGTVSRPLSLDLSNAPGTHFFRKGGNILRRSSIHSFVGSEQEFVFNTCLNGKPVERFQYWCYVVIAGLACAVTI